jgi:hypothetical protein
MFEVPADFWISDNAATGKVRRNFFIGVRIPPTRTSERVWNAMHRFAAKVWAAVGCWDCFSQFLPYTIGAHSLYSLDGLAKGSIRWCFANNSSDAKRSATIFHER